METSAGVLEGTSRAIFSRQQALPAATNVPETTPRSPLRGPWGGPPLKCVASFRAHLVVASSGRWLRPTRLRCSYRSGTVTPLWVRPATAMA